MKKLAIFVAFVLAVGLASGASAHKSQVVGNYEIEVGWQNEPPIVDQDNAITIMITNAAEHQHDEEATHDDEMMHDENETATMDHMQEEHEQVLKEHEQIMQEHNEAMKGNLDKADVEKMMHDHMSLMEKHEKIMQEHESMKDQMTSEQFTTMMASHEQIRKDHEQMSQDHDKIMEMYGIDDTDHDSEDHDAEAHDDGHDSEGISGLESTFESYVTVNGKMTALEFVEDQDMPGMYVAQYTPTESGYPIVHLTITTDDGTSEVDFHLEKIKEHVASPRQQQSQGVAPNEVECNAEKVLMSKASNGAAICVTQDTADKLFARNWAKYF